MSYFAPIPSPAALSTGALLRQASCDLPVDLPVTEAELDLLASWLLDEVVELGMGRNGGMFTKGKE